MSKAAIGLIGLAIIWGGFGYAVWSDPTAVCGIFFPLVMTGHCLDIMEGN